MSVQAIFDWKFVVALGGSVVAIIAFSKMDKTAIEKVSIHVVDSAIEYVAASVEC